VGSGSDVVSGLSEARWGLRVNSAIPNSEIILAFLLKILIFVKIS
jgi:hypothetical protein